MTTNNNNNNKNNNKSYSKNYNKNYNKKNNNYNKNKQNNNKKVEEFKEDELSKTEQFKLINKRKKNENIEKEIKEEKETEVKNNKQNNKKNIITNKNNKIIKKNPLPKYLIAIFFLALSIFFIVSITSLNIIPNKFLILGSAILLVLNTIANLCMFSIKKWKKILAIIIQLIIIVVSAFGIHFAYVTNHFLDTAFNNAETVYKHKFFIITNKELEEKDLNEKDVYYYKDAININDAITKFKEKYNVNFKPIDDLEKIFSEENFLVDDTTYDMFIEEFKLDTSKQKVVTSIELEYDVEDEQETEETTNPEEPKTPNNEEQKEEPKKDNSDHYFNVYLGGYDFSGRRMDLNKLITINTETNEILIINIHRYTYLDVPGYNQKNTLSSMSTYGVKNNVKALEKLFGIKIDYYLAAKTEGLVKLVDDIGGINYCSSLEFTTVHAKVLGTYDDSVGDKVHVVKGCQHLDGIETLTVARERLAFEMGAVERDKNTTNIMLDILEQMKKPANLSKYSTILNDVSGMYTTSIPRKVITKSVKQLLTRGWSIKTVSLKGRNGTDKVHFSNVKGSVQYPNQSSVNQIKSRIAALDK